MRKSKSNKLEPIDISIALDTSGSMDLEISTNSQISRISAAKEAIRKFISHLNFANNFAITAFKETTYIEITPLINKSGYTEGYKMILDEIFPEGGALLTCGLDSALQPLFNSNRRNRRIIIITDTDEIEDDFEEKFNEVVNLYSIPITIFGIGEYRLQKLNEIVMKNEGCNYFIVKDNSDMVKYLIDDFNRIFFPLSYNFSIQFISFNRGIKKCIGGSIVKVNKYNNNKHDINSNIGIDNFKRSIYLMILLSNRLKKKIPSSLLKKFSLFLICNKNIILQSKIYYPSKTIAHPNGILYSYGGLILLKLINTDPFHRIDIDTTFELKYTDINGNNILQIYNYQPNNNLFSSIALNHAIAVYFYGKFFLKLYKIDQIRSEMNAPYRAGYSTNKKESKHKGKYENMKLVELAKLLQNFVLYKEQMYIKTLSFFKNNFHIIPNYNDSKFNDYIIKLTEYYSRDE